MPTLQQVRRRMITILLVFLALDAAAIGFLLSPWGSSRAALQDQRNQLFQKVKAEESEVLPLRDIDKKLDVARVQMADFEKHRLASEYSAISATLGNLGNDTHVQISGIHYEPDKEPEQGLQRVAIDATLSGDYPSIAKFINEMERSDTFFLIDSIALQQQQGGHAALSLKFETYMRSSE